MSGEGASTLVVWSTCHGVISLQLRDVDADHVDWHDVHHDAPTAVIRGPAL